MAKRKPIKIPENVDQELELRRKRFASMLKVIFFSAVLIFMIANGVRLNITASSLNTKRVYLNANGTRIGGLLMGPSSGGPYPAVIAVHGFGETKEGIPEAYELANRGVVVLSIDLPCHGESTGKLQYGGEYYIVLSAIEYLRNLSYVNKSLICLYGISYGGLVVLNAGISTGSDVKAVVAVSAPTNLTYMWEYERSLIERFYTAREAVPPSLALLENNSPVLRLNNATSMPHFYLIHGYNDTIVSVRHALDFEKRAKELSLAINVTLLNNTDHNIYHSQVYFDTMSKIFVEIMNVSLSGTSIYNDIFLARVFVAFGTGGMAMVAPLLFMKPKKRIANKSREWVGFLNFFVFLALTTVTAMVCGWFAGENISYMDSTVLFDVVLFVVNTSAFLVFFTIEEKLIYHEKKPLQRLKAALQHDCKMFIDKNTIIALIISLSLLGTYQLIMYYSASQIFTVFDASKAALILLLSFIMLYSSELWLRLMFQSRIEHEIIFPVGMLLFFIMFMPHYFYYRIAFNMPFSNMVWPWLAGMIIVYRNSRSSLSSTLYFLPFATFLLTTVLHL